jgi:hypothetical protein
MFAQAVAPNFSRTLPLELGLDCDLVQTWNSEANCLGIHYSCTVGCFSEASVYSGAYTIWTTCMPAISNVSTQ